jgi:hypothetical protein
VNTFAGYTKNRAKSGMVGRGRAAALRPGGLKTPPDLREGIALDQQIAAGGVYEGTRAGNHFDAAGGDTPAGA